MLHIMDLALCIDLYASTFILWTDPGQNLFAGRSRDDRLQQLYREYALWCQQTSTLAYKPPWCINESFRIKARYPPLVPGKAGDVLDKISAEQYNCIPEHRTKEDQRGLKQAHVVLCSYDLEAHLGREPDRHQHVDLRLLLRLDYYAKHLCCEWAWAIAWELGFGS